MLAWQSRDAAGHVWPAAPAQIGDLRRRTNALNAYDFTLVNTAKEEPDGLGSLAEEVALAGQFFVPKEQKVTDPGQEQLLLHATVEELVRRYASLDCR